MDKMNKATMMRGAKFSLITFLFMYATFSGNVNGQGQELKNNLIIISKYLKTTFGKRKIFHHFGLQQLMRLQSLLEKKCS